MSATPINIHTYIAIYSKSFCQRYSAGRKPQFTRFSSHVSTTTIIINPRHACAARVTVLGLCVCVCVSVTTFSATTHNRTSNMRYQRPQRDMRKLFKMVFSLKMRRLEVRALAIRATKSAILLHVHSPYTVRASAWYCV